jgi:hypothetical protein
VVVNQSQHIETGPINTDKWTDEPLTNGQELTGGCRKPSK